MGSYPPYDQTKVLTANFTPDPDGKSDLDNDIAFTGQRFDAESRLMLYRHRFYHTGLGTFCSRDPVGYQGSEWSLYDYVEGRAVNFVDTYGMSLGGAAAIGGIAAAYIACLAAHYFAIINTLGDIDDKFNHCFWVCSTGFNCGL